MKLRDYTRKITQMGASFTSKLASNNIDDETGHLQLDSKFITSLLAVVALCNSTSSRLQSTEVEQWLKLQFDDYTSHLLSMAHVHNQVQSHQSLMNISVSSSSFKMIRNSKEVVSPISPNSVKISHLSNSSRRIYDRNSFRVSQLLDADTIYVTTTPYWLTPEKSASLSSSSKNIDTNLPTADYLAPRSDKNLRKLILRLQMETKIPALELETILAGICGALTDEYSVQGLLALLPETKSVGGLHLIASSLFSQSPSVRLQALKILLQVDAYESTQPAFTALNGALMTAYKRNVLKSQNGSLQNEIVKYQTRNSNIMIDNSSDNSTTKDVIDTLELIA
jgi:hypothetical protein